MANTEHKVVNGTHPTKDDINEAIIHANKYHCSVSLDYSLHNRLCSLMIQEGDVLEKVLKRPFQAASV